MEAIGGPAGCPREPNLREGSPDAGQGVFLRFHRRSGHIFERAEPLIRLIALIVNSLQKNCALNVGVARLFRACCEAVANRLHCCDPAAPTAFDHVEPASLRQDQPTVDLPSLGKKSYLWKESGGPAGCPQEPNLREGSPDAAQPLLVPLACAAHLLARPARIARSG